MPNFEKKSMKFPKLKKCFNIQSVRFIFSINSSAETAGVLEKEAAADGADPFTSAGLDLQVSARRAAFLRVKFERNLEIGMHEQRDIVECFLSFSEKMLNNRLTTC